MTHLIRHDAAAEIAVQAVLDSLDSPHSRRAYERHLREFILWYKAKGHGAMNKAVVQRYAAELRARGLSSATIIKSFQQFASLLVKRLTMEH